MKALSTDLKLNIGCGDRCVEEWINLDFAPVTNDVLRHDLLSPLPFSDNTFSVVYSSHVLEHFSPASAKTVLRECWRVMRPTSVIRIVVPDLERLVRSYLKAFEECGDEPSAIALHEWSIIQLIDQFTRDEPGGEMVKFLDALDLEDSWAISQTSKTANEMLSRRKSKRANSSQDGRSVAISKRLGRFGSRICNLVGSLRNIANRSRHSRFSDSGELHKWMYDRKSLTRLMQSCGFHEVQSTLANVSRYPGWNRFGLDCNPDGSQYRPDSLYIEAVK